MLASIMVAAAADATAAAAIGAPHIVLLVMDDVGRSDTSLRFTNSTPDIPTPNLKYLADEGVRLTQLYVQPVCSPTRSALMTARFPFRDGMQQETTITPASEAHLPLTTPTLAKLLTKDGLYEAHAVGKCKEPTMLELRPTCI